MDDSTGLVKYDEARRALAEARSIDEVKAIRDRHDAMRVLAKQMKNREMEIAAAEIRIRAERRWGEMYRESKRLHKDARGRKTKKVNDDHFLKKVNDDHFFRVPFLHDMGVTRHESMRAQKIASINIEQFEATMASWREEMGNGHSPVSIAILKKISQESKDLFYNEKIEHSHALLHKDGSFITDIDAMANDVKSGIREAFGTIYIDPPWPYQNQGTRASTHNHYKTMTIDEICALPVGDLAASESHLHLWTTNGFLFECPKLFEAWGFTFKSSFVWVKPQIGIGNYWRNAHELLLLGVKGGQTALDKSLPSWIEADRMRHSEKPERIRAFIQRLSPGPYLEIFGRKMVDGWVVYGNECEQNSSMAVVYEQGL